MGYYSMLLVLYSLELGVFFFWQSNISPDKPINRSANAFNTVIYQSLIFFSGSCIKSMIRSCTSRWKMKRKKFRGINMTSCRVELVTRFIRIEFVSRIWASWLLVIRVLTEPSRLNFRTSRCETKYLYSNLEVVSEIGPPFCLKKSVE